jgi:hypothetical protein
MFFKKTIIVKLLIDNEPAMLSIFLLSTTKRKRKPGKPNMGNQPKDIESR